jgi:2-C-methyl-D-erythritol 4-phosphate cytidylyltransferase
LETFLAIPEIASVWVGVSPDMALIPGADWPTHSKLHVVKTGGQTRQETVANTLDEMLSQGLPANDWVLVHDAARPGLKDSVVKRLIEAVIESHACGGILALPLADTLKQASVDQSGVAVIQRTLPRDGLWVAQTPQMFRLQALSAALRYATSTNCPVTDEASAMEIAGHTPLLVMGDGVNLKVTYPSDWSLMETLLKSSIS